jgi:DNA repair exonuclease SbcCD ATPase subunit
MLEIQSISWRNFMSYGDEIYNLELANLGQVLITGNIEDGSDGLKKSNGSGKSTIPNLPLWVLFGRTMHSANPGDSVINYHTGKECWGKVTFKNGDSVTRTRGTKGHNELVYVKDGEELILSTSKNLQQLINKDLKLDWELFTSSAFFTQYGRSWLEMADNNRKKALERVLRVDRFAHYANASKKATDAVNAKISSINSKISTHENNINRLQASIAKQERNKSNYEENKINRVKTAETSITAEMSNLENLVLPDINKLEKTWSVYNQILNKIGEMEDSYKKASMQENNLSSKLEDAETKILNWTRKQGKQCLSCLQDITEGHIHGQIDPLKEKQIQLAVEHEACKTKAINLRDKIADAKAKLRERKPEISISEAKALHSQKARIEKEIARLTALKEEIVNEINPYTEALDGIDVQIEDENKLISKEMAVKTEQELLYKHYSYIHKAYSERNKIKSYVFKEHIPFINKRLNHYLEMLNLDVRVNLTDNLGVTSNMWSYDFQSGGERKRTDVAFMLAAFDFHEAMYGRQCNILVLDEVDGRMDDDGIDGLINIIKQELSRKVETILIISHRNQMHDVFDKEIKVVKTNGFSRIQM